MSGANVTHVPYKAGVMSVNATLGGEIEMIFLNAFQAAPLIHSGKLRGLAVTSLQRSRFLPALPTLDESGLKGWKCSSFTASPHREACRRKSSSACIPRLRTR